MSDVLYHASPVADLDERGIVPRSRATASTESSEYVYLGPLEYVLEHYLDYAPAGRYYVYEVDVGGMQLDAAGMPGGQVRTNDVVSPERVSLFDVVDSEPDVYPGADEYLEWWGTTRERRDPFIGAVADALIEASNAELRDLRAQIRDLDASIDDLKLYRDRCPRGSSRRADFASSINRLQDWRKKLEKKVARAEDAVSMKEGVEPNIIDEGGVAGHLKHLYDNWDMTFGDMKDVFEAASIGELEEVTEKLDGQNLFVTWNVEEGRLKAARNQGNIKSGGLDAEGLAGKFAGRGPVYDAFVSGFNVISKAVGSLSPREKVEVFGPSGDIWYSVEIMFVDNPNTIVYDRNNVVFHRAGSAAFDRQTGKPLDVDIDGRFDKLVSRIDDMQSAVSDEAWRLAKPALMRLKAMEDGSALATAKSRIDSVMSEYGMSDSDTLGSYLKARIYTDYVEPLGLDGRRAEALVQRIMGEKGAPTATQLASGIDDPSLATRVKELTSSGLKPLKAAIAPIEDAVHDFAVEVLRGLESAFILDNRAEVERLRGQVTAAVDAIEASGYEDAMAVLQQQMRKLKSVENVAAAMEGVVFRFKGHTYKFTGAFAPANQLIGLFKYGRGKVPPLHAAAKGGTSMDKPAGLGEALDRFFSGVNTERVTLCEAAADDVAVGEGLARVFNIGGAQLVEKKTSATAGKRATEKLTYNRYVPWSAAAKRIPYEGRAGVGPGEERLARIFGGEVQGGNVSYDVVAGGKKWEVKEPDDRGEIRPGTEGMRAIASLMQDLTALGQELRNGFSQLDPQVAAAAFEGKGEEILTGIKGFIDNDLPKMIDKGEVSSGRVFGGARQKGYSLVDVLKGLKQLLGSTSDTPDTKKIVYGDNEHQVDLPTYVRVGRILDVPEDEMDVTPGDVFSAKFTHRAFKDVDGFLADYMNSIKASHVFSGTDGVILVDPGGYRVVPKAALDKHLAFSRITQGKPKFKVVG